MGCCKLAAAHFYCLKQENVPRLLPEYGSRRGTFL